MITSEINHVFSVQNEDSRPVKAIVRHGGYNFAEDQTPRDNMCQQKDATIHYRWQNEKKLYITKWCSILWSK